MLLVADNLNILKPCIAQALERGDPEPIRQLVRRCLGAGAQAFDLNAGPLTREPEERFAFLVETVQSVTSVPLLLDTTNPAALGAGLAVCRNPAIVNGFSLEPAKLAHILPLARQHDTDIVGYLLHPDHRLPMDEDEMMQVAVSLCGAFTGSGTDTARLIIDPVVAPLSWQDGIRHNLAVLSVLRRLPELLGTPVRTLAGLSNLTTGPASAHQKEVMETAYLSMLASAGLDMVLFNVFHGAVVQAARASRALLGRTLFTWAEISPYS